ncbi:MAG: DNA polymerase III subunit gamma/tau [Muribaculaceae bacterium]|nr:DNA polymerase III subunit gamma/tau [Muribaculaceae bacterium]
MDNNTYIVSARKYRPSTFQTVVGQQALTHTLKSAIASGRLAHAYLFCGPRGVGKTTCARIFAKTINCEHPTADGEACNECPSCRAFNEQVSFNIIELDAASNNGVDDIRDLTEQVRIPPQTGRYKVYIIDEVHMLSQAAFNAFLKTLEEPPEYAIFILATTEKQKLIPTILSRCQIYDFARITVPDIAQQLRYVCQQEGIEAEDAALNVIAQKADGAMRDALSIFDQVTASSRGHITYQSAIDNLNVLDYEYYFRLVDAFLGGDVPQAMLIYKEIRDNGFDSQFFVNGLAQHLRDLMVASTPQTRILLEMNDEAAQRYVQQAGQMTPAMLYRALDLCNTCDLNYRNASSKQLLVELTLIKLCQLSGVAPQPAEAPAQPIKKIAAAPAPQPHPAPAPPTATPPQPQPAPAPPTATATAKPVARAARPLMGGMPAPRPAAPASTTRVAAPAAPAVKKQPADTAPAAPAAPVTATRHEAFTAEQLQAAWQAYIDQHPNEHITVSTMRLARPARINDTLYQIEVESQGQVEHMEKTKGGWLNAMRDAVGNDMLAIDVKIGEKMSDHRILTPREVVNNIREHNPNFNKFIQDFQLSLA